MKTVHALVLAAAGTNCDRETIHAFELAGANATRVHVGRLVEVPRTLDSAQILVLPGGFTYGDDVGAGRILGLELEKRLGDELASFVDSGRIVIGVCNGFQVLVRMGLLPGVRESLSTTAPRSRWTKGLAALTENDSGRFECRWVTLESRADSIFAPREVRLQMPVAHAEGKFVVKDAATLERLVARGQVAFVYASARSGARRSGLGVEYPENPNGSVAGIAGITDESGRVLGMMPHPERFVEPEQHPTWTRQRASPSPDDGEPVLRTDGRMIFDRAVTYAREVLP